MKIDFTKLKVEVLVDKYEVRDVAKQLANAIFASRQDLDDDTLMRKIYASTGEIELSQDERNRLERLMRDANVAYNYRTTIMDILNG